jgi:PHD/YefM family antitoxin component YafN of YafNO toxin-antitoxin module
MKNKKNSQNIEPQYIVNNLGKKTAVVLDIKLYEQMLESLEDAYLSAKSDKALATGKFVEFKKNNKKVVKK